MNSHLDMHPIRLRPPYFGASAQGAIHRYLDPEFVPRFQQDLLTQGFPDNTWQQEDRFSGHDDKLVLRLPMHRCFYLVSCEVSCERLGLPALDPARIASAGFVIRRLAPQGEQGWMLEHEKAIGWELSPTGLRDPDLNRRVCRNGKLHALPGNPAYSGEQTHPLHALVTRDTNGKCHTVLYGYVPLGGSYTLQKRAGITAPPFEGDSLALFKTQVAEQLPWPYGLKQPLDRRWTDDCTRPVNKGMPTAQWVALLKMLVNTHHLGEADIGDNQRLEQLARNLYPEEIGRAPTLTRKLKEAITALKIEALYSKDEILETYLNTVPFLYNVVGIEMAARTYFDKPASDLDVLESASLSHRDLFSGGTASASRRRRPSSRASRRQRADVSSGSSLMNQRLATPASSAGCVCASTGA